MAAFGKFGAVMSFRSNLLQNVVDGSLGSVSAAFWFAGDHDLRNGRHTSFGLFLGLFGLPLFFALLYQIENGGCLNKSHELTKGGYLYFSYTTYTTLGYAYVLH